MKLNLLLCFTVMAFHLQSQADTFRMAFNLRMIGDTVILDVSPQQDYNIVAFQFGISHSSPDVDFLKITTPMPNYDRNLRFNERCKNVVYNLWHSPNLDPYPMKGGEAFISFYFIERSPTNHFLKLLPSRISPHDICAAFPREFIGANNQLLYLPDVSIDYTIQNSQLIILNQQEVIKNKPAKVYYAQDNHSVIVEPADDLAQSDLIFSLFSLDGKQILAKKLENTGPWSINIPATGNIDGIQSYRLSNSNGFSQSGKIWMNR